MYGRLVAIVTKADKCWDALVDVYQEDYRVEDVVSAIAKKYREVFVEPREELVEGDVQGASATHILTWDDGMDETIRIYEII